MKEYFSEVMEDLTEAISSMDMYKFEQMVEECVQTLDENSKIVVSGLGKNVPICEKFVGTMLSLGQAANFMHTNTAAHGDIGMVMPEDLVIVLSKSGETAETKYLIELLQNRNSKIWLLTFNEDSSQKEYVHGVLSLNLNAEGDAWNLVPNNSSTINLIVLQGLALKVAEKRGVSLMDFKRNHPGGYIGEVLKNV